MRIEARHQDVEWSRCDGFDQCGNFRWIADTRSVKAIGTRISVGDETRERCAEWLWTADKKRFAPSGQDDGAARFVDGPARGSQSGDGELFIVKPWMICSGRIFDREPSHSGREAERDVGGNFLGRIGKTREKIGIDGQRRGFRMCTSISSREIVPSDFPQLKAYPAEVVASALNPSRCK